MTIQRVNLATGQKPTDTDWEDFFNRCIDYINAGLQPADLAKDASGKVGISISGDAATVGGKTADQIAGGNFPEVKKTLIDLMTGGSPLVLKGGVATKDGTTANKLNVTTCTAIQKVTSTGYIDRVDLATVSKTTTLANATYYLDIVPGAADFTWGTAHPSGDYMQIATVTTDVNANISTVVDNRSLSAVLLNGFDAKFTIDASTLNGRSDYFHTGNLMPFLDKFAAGGIDGDLTLDGTNTTNNTYTMTGWKFYRNLTIPVGYTFNANNSNNLIFVSGTLTLNGTIVATNGGAGGGVSAGGGGHTTPGSGGQGAGNVTLIANKIVGSGTIDVSGNPGTDAVAGTGNNISYSSGYSGTGGSFMGVSFNGGNGCTTNNSTFGTSVAGHDPSPNVNNFLISQQTISGAGGSGGGGGDVTTANTPYISGGGGGGCYGSGGNGAYDSTNSYNYLGNPGTAGGGGGGSAGCILLESFNSVPAITLKANGGKGGNGTSGQGFGGGGGGGGFIMVMAPSSSASMQANGGAAGTSYGTIPTPASAGGPGMTRMVTI